MILGIQQDLKSEGIKVTISQLCRWFEVPRRTAYYKPCKASPKVQKRFEAPITAMIAQDPSFGLPHGGGATQIQQEHGATYLPDSGVAGQAKAYWV